GVGGLGGGTWGSCWSRPPSPRPGDERPALRSLAEQSAADQSPWECSRRRFRLGFLPTVNPEEPDFNPRQVWFVRGQPLARAAPRGRHGPTDPLPTCVPIARDAVRSPGGPLREGCQAIPGP